jgi:hypothetical protein
MSLVKSSSEIFCRHAVDTHRYRRLYSQPLAPPQDERIRVVEAKDAYLATANDNREKRRIGRTPLLTIENKEFMRVDRLIQVVYHRLIELRGGDVNPRQYGLRGAGSTHLPPFIPDAPDRRLRPVLKAHFGQDILDVHLRRRLRDAQQVGDALV